MQVDRRIDLRDAPANREMTMKHNCAHDACTCEHEADQMVKQDGKFYCSEHCASAPPDGDECHCGHPGCG